MLKVGNTIGECLALTFFCRDRYLCIYVADKLIEEIGYGATGKIFKVINMKTKDIKAMKVIAIIGYNDIEISTDIRVGMELGRKCPYLIRYYNMFIEGDFYIIIMDYMKNGNVERYLKKVGKLKEIVCIFKNKLFYILILNIYRI
jgi:serine/threonine protein kinase